MELRDFREAYPGLAPSQFNDANALLPWAAVAAAESDNCSRVEVAAVSLRATQQSLQWTIFCGQNRGNSETFEITREQAEAARDKYDPATPEARDAAQQVATAEPISARWKAFDERPAVSACKNLVRDTMVNQGSFGSAWTWETLRNHETGNVVIEQDFDAKNRFGGTISSRYRCVVDPEDGGAIKEVFVRELNGWQRLI